MADGRAPSSSELVEAAEGASPLGAEEAAGVDACRGSMGRHLPAVVDGGQDPVGSGW